RASVVRWSSVLVFFACRARGIFLSPRQLSSKRRVRVSARRRVDSSGVCAQSRHAFRVCVFCRATERGFDIAAVGNFVERRLRAAFGLSRVDDTAGHHFSRRVRVGGGTHRATFGRGRAFGKMVCANFFVIRMAHGLGSRERNGDCVVCFLVAAAGGFVPHPPTPSPKKRGGVSPFPSPCRRGAGGEV